MTTSILFFGALLDALIGANIFVHGEPFLLMAGYQLYQGTGVGILAVALGGLIGDQASYLIGRKLGANAQRRLIAWQPKTKRPVARCRLLIKSHGNVLMMFARLLGPVAWVVPFMVGSQRVAWWRFTVFSTFGLILGVGQWVLWGYLLASGINALSWWEGVQTFLLEHQRSLWVAFFGLVLMIMTRFWRIRYAKTAIAVYLAASLVWTNYEHFFYNSDDFIAKSPIYFEPDNRVFKVYAGKSKNYDAQGVNVIFHGDNPAELMTQLGWFENKTFSRHQLNLRDFWQLLKNKTPPVSDLFWQGQPQNLAYQKAGTLSQRVHIRWWFAGTNKRSGEKMWVGALSYDDGLIITMHSGTPTILHRVDADIDKQRNDLSREISTINAQIPANWQTQLLPLAQPIVQDSAHDYFSDGKILVISEKLTGFLLTSNQRL